MEVVVGLGNPGPDYVDTRHNLGFRVVARLADELGSDVSRSLPRSVWGPATVGDRKIVLARPLRFVNASGEAVLELLRAHSADTSDLTVVHDDLDLRLGQIRVRAGGASGGHRGVQSIIDALGTERFKRVRIGLGRPPGRKDPARFVLERFSKREISVAEEAIVVAAEAVLVIVSDGASEAMNRFNKADT